MRLTNQVVEIGQILRKSSQQLAIAESCTGGLISSVVTAEAGVSDFFVGSVVSYANSVKEDILSVGAETLIKFGAVSEAVAKEMAIGVCKQMKAHWGVAVTGIAGPSGGTEAKPVGTVCFAVHGPKLVVAQTKHFAGDRGQVQAGATQFALDFLIQCLKKEFN